MQRRQFLSRSAAAALVTSNLAAQGAGISSLEPTPTVPGSQQAAARIPRISDPGVRRGEMLYRPLGATGVEVSVIGLGGAHLGMPQITDAEAVRLIHQAIDRGINFLDNCWDYNDGRSERVVGNALAQGGYRQKAFVMTKIDGRTRQLASDQIDDSLKRLKVDHIDLLQHHEVIRYDDPDRIFNADGAMEAVAAAKRAGKVRFIGFTGHKDPHVHLYMLKVAREHGFHFDTVQMPINVMDAHYRSFAQLVVPTALGERIGVLGMKCFGSGVLMKSPPIADSKLSPIECLHYSLNVPVSVQINGINSQKLLDQAFEAVKTFQPMGETQVAAILRKTEQAALHRRVRALQDDSAFRWDRSTSRVAGARCPARAEAGAASARMRSGDAAVSSARPFPEREERARCFPGECAGVDQPRTREGPGNRHDRWGRRLPGA
jgi:aryl-alcohol dehydrogenase-like predicted oxidoreductase